MRSLSELWNFGTRLWRVGLCMHWNVHVIIAWQWLSGLQILLPNRTFVGRCASHFIQLLLPDLMLIQLIADNTVDESSAYQWLPFLDQQWKAATQRNNYMYTYLYLRLRSIGNVIHQSAVPIGTVYIHIYIYIYCGQTRVPCISDHLRILICNKTKDAIGCQESVFTHL